MKPYKTFIDWNKDCLYVYERRKNIILVNAIGEAIERGEEVPPIIVCNVDSNTFYLSAEGGHHRALAFYILGKPLPIKIYHTHKIQRIPEMFFPIGETVLFDHRTDFTDLNERFSEEIYFKDRIWKYPSLKSQTNYLTNPLIHTIY